MTERCGRSLSSIEDFHRSIERGLESCTRPKKLLKDNRKPLHTSTRNRSEPEIFKSEAEMEEMNPYFNIIMEN